MASGNITLYIESVDYPSGRGAEFSNLNARWNVDDNGYLTLTEESYNTNEQYWWICSSAATDINRYYVKWEVQFKPDGENWQSLYSSKVAVKGRCVDLDYRTGTNVKNMMETFCSGFPGVQLTKSGELRVICGANLAPAPDAGYPHAFPNDVYSEASQVPVHIDVSWDAKLRYNANGGSNAPAGVTEKESGSSHSFVVSNQQPTRKHFDFKGWATSAGGSATIYGGDTVTVTKDNPRLELYAVWEYTYRPGMIRVSGVWKSCDRDSNLVDGKYTTMLGRCHVLKNGTWTEMRTRANRTGTNNSPVIRKVSVWSSMSLIGDEGSPHDVSY